MAFIDRLAILFAVVGNRAQCFPVDQVFDAVEGLVATSFVAHQAEEVGRYRSLGLHNTGSGSNAKVLAGAHCNHGAIYWTSC